MRATLGALAALFLLTGCSGSGGDDAAQPDYSTPAPTTAAATAATTADTCRQVDDVDLTSWVGSSAKVYQAGKKDGAVSCEAVIEDIGWGVRWSLEPSSASLEESPKAEGTKEEIEVGGVPAYEYRLAGPALDTVTVTLVASGQLVTVNTDLIPRADDEAALDELAEVASKIAEQYAA